MMDRLVQIGLVCANMSFELDDGDDTGDVSAGELGCWRPDDLPGSLQAPGRRHLGVGCMEVGLDPGGRMLLPFASVVWWA